MTKPKMRMLRVLVAFWTFALSIFICVGAAFASASSKVRVHAQPVDAPRGMVATWWICLSSKA